MSVVAWMCREGRLRSGVLSCVLCMSQCHFEGLVLLCAALINVQLRDLWHSSSYKEGFQHLELLVLAACLDSIFTVLQDTMAPKTAEKQPASKAVAPKGKGAKKGKKKSVESWKIYIYKVGWVASFRMCYLAVHLPACVRRSPPQRSHLVY